MPKPSTFRSRIYQDQALGPFRAWVAGGDTICANGCEGALSLPNTTFHTSEIWGWIEGFNSSSFSSQSRVSHHTDTPFYIFPLALALSAIINRNQTCISACTHEGKHLDNSFSFFIQVLVVVSWFRTRQNLCWWRCRAIALILLVMKTLHATSYCAETPRAGSQDCSST